MPGDDNKKTEFTNLEEGMSFSEKGEIPTELKNKDMEKQIDDITEDREEPMTYERKLAMMAKIFPIKLGSKVRNKHCEDGIVEMVAIDFRGVLYLVEYKDHESNWEAENQIDVINDFGASERDTAKKEAKEPTIQTDIQSPDDPALKKKKPEAEITDVINGSSDDMVDN